ncbi:MAG TPA: GGDEF domain-containing protein [Solirubrobacterales bacterium]|nr:GGDEF domain-containing protein [Solirubrobacterales bacterium]
MAPTSNMLRDALASEHGPASSSESLAAIRAEARRERLLDGERRMRRYRAACFAILGLALASASPAVGWLWLAPLAAGFGGFAVADRFMQASPRPGLWVAGAWGLLPLLLAAAVIASGGPTSPALMWFALPAVTLGVRFEPWGMAVGTAYLLSVFLISTVAIDPVSAAAHSQTLVAALALILSTVILSGALVESDRAHRRRSTLDPLTGLFNRNALEQRLAELDGQPSNGKKGLSHALLLCDLDHFKRVNDKLGHAAGDAVLKDVADTMRAVLRAGDSIYRIGGEEILVILPGATEKDAVGIAERLRQAVSRRRPAGVEVTISIGAAVSGPPRVNTDDLVSRADVALYSAKAGGRDQVFVAN